MTPKTIGMRLIAALVLLGTLSCSAAADRTPAQALSARQFKQMLDQQTGDTDIVVLDIRTPREYRSGHIRSALLVDYYARDFIDRLKSLERDKTYLVYCRSGNRSAKSLAMFDRLGFRQVYHLDTGIRGWQRENFPLVN